MPLTLKAGLYGYLPAAKIKFAYSLRLLLLILLSLFGLAGCSQVTFQQQAHEPIDPATCRAASLDKNPLVQHCDLNFGGPQAPQHENPKHLRNSGHGFVHDLVAADPAFIVDAIRDFKLDASWAGDACAIESDISRMLNVIYLVKYAADPNDPAAEGLLSAYDWAAERIDQTGVACSLPMGCGDQANACNRVQPVQVPFDLILPGVGKRQVYFNRKRLFDRSVLKMSSVLVHEARHTDLNLYREAHPDWPSGPDSYEVRWLAWFAKGSNPALFPNDMRIRAAELANYEANRHGYPIEPVEPNLTGRLLRGYKLHPEKRKDLIDFRLAMPPEYMSEACQNSGRYYERVGAFNQDNNGDRYELSPEYDRAQNYCGSCGVVAQPSLEDAAITELFCDDQ